MSFSDTFDSTDAASIKTYYSNNGGYWKNLWLGLKKGIVRDEYISCLNSIILLFVLQES